MTTFTFRLTASVDRFSPSSVLQFVATSLIQMYLLPPCGLFVPLSFLGVAQMTVAHILFHTLQLQLSGLYCLDGKLILI